MTKPTLFLVASLAVATCGSRALAVDYASDAGGDWSEGTIWSPDAPAGGPGAADGAVLQHNVTYDAAAPGAVTWMFVAQGGSLAVADGVTFTFGGDGNNTIEIHSSGALSLGRSSRVIYTGGAMHFRSGSVNSLDFANSPADAKVSVSDNLSLVLGDMGAATLQIGADSNGARFGALGGGEEGVLDVDGATIHFGNWDGANRLRATGGAIVNSGYVAVYTRDAITLDNTAQLHASSHLYVRTPRLNIAGACLTVDGDLFSDWGFDSFEVNLFQNAGQRTGMTLNGALNLSGASDRLNLSFAAGSGTGDWIFRKKEISDSLTVLRDSGRITVNRGAGQYEIVNDGTYTTIRAIGGSAGSALIVR